MKTKVLIVVVLMLTGCAYAGETVSLTKAEAARAQSLTERRQAIHQQVSEAQVAFQLKMAQLQADENKVNSEADQMCFEFKKSHKLDPKDNYRLDEWNGQLVKVK